MIVMVIAVGLIAGLLYLLVRKNKALEETKTLLKEFQSKLKSTQVIYGKSWEHFVPFIKNFQKIANKEKAVFLGMPIDFIVFDSDYIKFIEVKTGNSKLSEKQVRIKKMVMDKKVKWHEVRCENEKG